MPWATGPFPARDDFLTLNSFYEIDHTHRGQLSVVRACLSAKLLHGHALAQLPELGFLLVLFFYLCKDKKKKKPEKV